MPTNSPKISVIIPARDAMATLPQAVESVLKITNDKDVEIIIINDGLDKDTSELPSRYPVKVIEGNSNGPAAARNLGVQWSRGEILIFLDADCRVTPLWLKVHLEAHRRHSGLLAVGGSICLEPNANFWARCDHYCAWYNVNPGLPASWVPNHPTANLSVAMSTFESVGPFKEDLPLAGGHEDLEWEKRLQRLGGRIRFEPSASVWHVERNTLRAYLGHNYLWGYNSIAVKGRSRVSRLPWLYRRPELLIAGFFPFAVAHTFYTSIRWLIAGKLEPLVLSPVLFLGRLGYASGMAIGGVRAILEKRMFDTDIRGKCNAQ